MDTETKTWITGEEFNRERRRLIRELGRDYADSPAFQSLLQRMQERNRYLFETYGRPLMEEHPGKRIAISTEGEVIVGERAGPLSHEATRRFGAGNFALWKLADPPGDVLRPRG